MLNRLKNLSADTVLYGLASASGQVIGFLLLPLYTKYLTVEDYGVLAMLTIVTAVFTPLFGIGVKPAVYRYVARSKSRRARRRVIVTASTGAALSGILGCCLMVAIAPLVSPFLIDSAPFYYVILAAATGGCTLVNQVPNTILRYDRRVKLHSILSLTGLLVSIVVTVALVTVYEWGVLGCLIGSFSGAVLQSVLLLAATRPFSGSFFRFKQFRLMLHYGLPFVPHSLQVVGLAYLGQYLVKANVSLEEAGLFNVAFKFVLPFQLIVTSIQKAWKPIKFQIHKEDADPRRTFRSILSIYCTLTGLMFLLTSLAGPRLLKMMVDVDFYSASKLVAFMALIPFAKGLYFMLGTGMEFATSPRKIPLISLLGIVTMLLFVPLIVAWGAIGAALATAFAWIVMAIAVFLYAQSLYGIPYDYGFVIFVTILTCSCGLAASELDLSLASSAIAFLVTSLVCVVGLRYRVSDLSDFGPVIPS